MNALSDNASRMAGRSEIREFSVVAVLGLPGCSSGAANDADSRHSNRAFATPQTRHPTDALARRTTTFSAAVCRVPRYWRPYGVRGRSFTAEPSASLASTRAGRRSDAGTDSESASIGSSAALNVSSAATNFTRRTNRSS